MSLVDSIDMDSIYEKDKEMLDTIISKYNSDLYENTCLDDIKDIYTARRILLLLLKENKRVSGIAEDAINTLKELTEKITSSEVSDGKKSTYYRF